jgi:hypothetical protein
MVSLLSYAIDHLANNHRALSFSQVKGADESLWLWLGGTAAAALVIGTLASIAINTNRFSLHGMYRNRLIRAFLGASNDRRQPNRFTGFDENDNFRLSELWPNAPCASRIPPQLFVSNMALNIVATKELAWQERKALSFTGTSRWIGSGSLHETGCYPRADRFGSAMSLGTAMTISGAAASPNMGYHSSPTLSVLLTFFNVRLGAWLGNPGPAGARTYALQGPFFAIKPLVQEAFGLTTDDREYVYLSDGGHFENLGLYEMVRRRCHLIVVSDAGCDPVCTFEDLGNAVRKIAIDQHVAINFRRLTIGARHQPPVKGTYCAVADIIYPEPEARHGVLLYLKPGYQGIEPASVRSYAAAKAAFPHEPTSDQWFGESQFEAYRALGEYILQSLDGAGGRAYPSIKDFIDAVAAKLRAPPDPLPLQVNYRLHGRMTD